MDFKLKYYNDTKKAIVNIARSSNSVITCKKIKEALKIRPNDRSKTNFVWRALEELEKEGFIKLNGSTTKLKSYKLSSKRA